VQCVHENCPETRIPGKVEFRRGKKNRVTIVPKVEKQA
jgi:hypothetical protein